jgi:hypothetical protein
MREPTNKQFLDNVSPEPNTGCWLWTGSLTYNGYGTFSVWMERRRSVNWRAHRLAWFMAHGSVPSPPLELDHLCRVRSCVNPKHLEPVTRSVNTRRGLAGVLNKARAAAKTHCINGHPYTLATVYRSPKEGLRGCRICRAAANEKCRKRKEK